MKPRTTHSTGSGLARFTSTERPSSEAPCSFTTSAGRPTSLAPIMTRYILPNVFPPILVQATLTIATAIIAEASLSFFGLGQQPPAPSWGSMLNTAKNFLSQAPWMAIWPGAGIFLVVMGFNLMGDGLRDALDPREH